jgi:hypothetical protein
VPFYRAALSKAKHLFVKKSFLSVRMLFKRQSPAKKRFGRTPIPLCNRAD